MIISSYLSSTVNFLSPLINCKILIVALDVAAFLSYFRSNVDSLSTQYVDGPFFEWIFTRMITSIAAFKPSNFVFEAAAVLTTPPS